MHFLFLDESGDLKMPIEGNRDYFVVGGVTIPAAQWHQIQKDFACVKNEFNVHGELKWRYFGDRKGQHAISHLDIPEKEALRKKVFDIVNKYQSIKIMCCVTDIHHACQKYSLKSINDLYYYTYKPVTERFQYYLQDLSRTIGSAEPGLVVCDQQSCGMRDGLLRDLHQRLLQVEGQNTSKYENMVEGLMLAPSHHSVGVQLADIVVGAVGRFFNRKDDRWFQLLEPSWRRNPKTGKKEGWGLVRFPT